jgi:hypothetical protein
MGNLYKRLEDGVGKFPKKKKMMSCRPPLIGQGVALYIELSSSLWEGMFPIEGFAAIHQFISSEEWPSLVNKWWPATFLLHYYYYLK